MNRFFPYQHCSSTLSDSTQYIENLTEDTDRPIKGSWGEYAGHRGDGETNDINRSHSS